MNLRSLEARLDRVEQAMTPQGGAVVVIVETDDPAEARRQEEAARAKARARGAQLVIYEFEGVPA